MDAKRGKACPHDFKELCSFDYSVFLDSKLRVDTRKIEELICTHGAPAYFRRHPFVTGPVWNEYNLSMYQKRYEVQKDAYRAYIAHQVAQGLVEETPDHLACGFIIRDMHHLAVKEMGEAWMRHIHECGIQDQISFYFVKQLFPGLVRPIEPSEDILI